MSNNIPNPVKICHIIHLDKLPAILEAKCLLCDAEIQRRNPAGTTIGMGKIKRRHLEELRLSSYPDLHVGDCVPFYFCPRSVMLYMFHCNNHPEIEYKGGQAPIIHLVADMHRTIQWAARKRLRCAFTTSNAGSYYFEDYTKEKDLEKINWNVVGSNEWRGHQDEKQAEFLAEKCFPWTLVEKIGVYSETQYGQVNRILAHAVHRPQIEIKRNWYY